MPGLGRREFVALLGAAAAGWPLSTFAQSFERVKRIGVLMGTNDIPSDPLGLPLFRAFVDRLQQLGWTDGQNVQIASRWASGDAAKFRVLAQDLADLKPHVIVAQSNLAVTALQQTDKHIPIVFVQVSDPIGRGFVATLARPGGNTTGFSNFEESMGGKWLEKLKEIAPKVTRVALMFNASTSPHIAAGFYLRAAEEAGRRSAVQTSTMQVNDAAEIERSIGKFAEKPEHGLIVLPDSFTLVHADLIVSLAARFRLPAIYPFRSFAAPGGLLIYGINTRDQYVGAASYVDRILKGALPAELPVQAPSRFELIVNLKTAKTLDLDVPLQLQQLADEVIE
jgi:ABC-type uncharacterized transport system substrate-binding protein